MRQMVGAWVFVDIYRSQQWRWHPTYFWHDDQGYIPGWQVNFGRLGVTVRNPSFLHCLWRHSRVPEADRWRGESRDPT